MEATKLGFRFKKVRVPKVVAISLSIVNIIHVNKKIRIRSKKHLRTSDTLICNSFYRFIVDKKKDLLLRTFDIFRTHEGIDFQDLTEPMRGTLKEIPKFQKSTDVVPVLEIKFKCSLNYQNVYYELRKIHALFGPKDCQHFLIS